MADSKISALTALTGANVATDDAFPIVDTSVTTTKKITADELRIAVAPAWTTPSFSAGDYTASESMTWTVASGDVTTSAYSITGKRMTWAFQIDTTTVGGTPSNELRIAIPGSKTATKTMSNAVQLLDNNTYVSGFCFVLAGETTLRIRRSDNANFTASTNLTYVNGQITFEIN
jgi:hypothetical protein